MQASSTLNSISKTVQSYFDGMHYGDTSRPRSALHPDAFLFGYYDGEFSRISLDDWMSEVEGMDKPSETGEAFDMVIVSIDVTREVPILKLDVPNKDPLLRSFLLAAFTALCVGPRFNLTPSSGQS
jgi:hypothetical protein